MEAIRCLSEVVESKKKRKKLSGKSALKTKKSKKMMDAAQKVQQVTVAGA